MTSSQLPPAASKLWQKALDRLDDDVKSNLDLSNPSRLDIVAAVHKIGEEKKQICLAKRWKFKNSKGEEIIVRDLLEKVIIWLDAFKAVGDVAMQYDAGHAALPWAPIRFLLGIAVSHRRVHGAMVEGLETVARLITRLAYFEKLYLQRASIGRGELEDAIVALYAEVLIYLGKAIKFYEKKSTVRKKLDRAIHIVAVEPVEEDQMQRIATQEARLSSLTRLADAELRQNTNDNITSIDTLLKRLDEPINRLAGQANSPVEILEGNKPLKILRWLSTIPFSMLHKGHSENRIPTTGGWLLNHTQYRSWHNESLSSILLLEGVPGSGKTATASAVVDSFLDQSPRHLTLTRLAYFYCTKNPCEAERSNPDEIMRSLLRQLTFPHNAQDTVHEGLTMVHEALKLEYERRNKEAELDGFDISRLRAAQCVKLILDVIGTDPAVFVLDAIDEVQETRRHELLDALQQIVAESASVVKIFITSRNDSKVLALLPDVQRICISSSDTRADMELFVCHHVDHVIRTKRLLCGAVTESLRQDIINAFLGGAEEIFLWVFLQIDSLCRLKVESDVRMAAQRLSRDTLEHLYAVIYGRIRGSSASARSIAIRAFSLLLCSREALSPGAFLGAMNNISSECEGGLGLSQLCDICCNLLVVDVSMKMVRFIHVSVQEYLEFQAEFAPPYIHGLAAIECLNMCMYGTPPVFQNGLDPAMCFAQYASLYWPEHSRQAISTEGSPEVQTKIEEFVFDDADVSLSFTGWLDDVVQLRSFLANDHPLKTIMNAIMNAEYSPLFTACAFGLTGLLDKIGMTAHFDWNRKSESGHTGLYLASVTGHENIVRKLIQHGADVNADGGKYTYPLHAAAFEGHIYIVRILLDVGAHVMSRGFFDSAYQAAFLGHHEDIAMVLLGSHYELSCQAEYDSIEQQAAEAGFFRIVDFLTKKYPSFSQHTPTHCKAVEQAILKGQTGVVKRFLGNSNDLEHEIPPAAISMAAIGGHNAIISLLLERDQDIECEGQLGSPLRAASIMGHESTVRLLLDNGAHVNRNRVHGTALQASASKGYISITKLLLQEGADVDARGPMRESALQAAAFHGHKSVVETLLDAGADAHQKGLWKDATDAAVSAGHYDIVRLLDDRGFRTRHPLRVVFSGGCCTNAKVK